MKSLMQRWKMVPSYKGTPVFVWPVAGSLHCFSPVASPTKFSTVFGALPVNSRTAICPSLVSKVAVSGRPARASFIIPTLLSSSALADQFLPRLGGLGTLVGDDHFGEHHVLVRPIGRTGSNLGDLLDHVVAGYHLAEDGVFVVQPRGLRHGDEELRSVGRRAGDGHRQKPHLVERERALEFILEFIARVSGPISQRIATLDHEIGDDSVEDGPVVESPARLLVRFGVGPLFFPARQADEVGHCLRSVLRIQHDGDVALRCFQRCVEIFPLLGHLHPLASSRPFIRRGPARNGGEKKHGDQGLSSHLSSDRLQKSIRAPPRVQARSYFSLAASNCERARAAACSASFLLRPHPRAVSSGATATSTSNVFSCSGPVSEMTRYLGARRRRFCTASCSSVL